MNETHKAFGIHKNKVGEWVVSEIRYTPGSYNKLPTVSTEVIEHSNSGGLRDMAIEAFKIKVIEEGIFND